MAQTKLKRTIKKQMGQFMTPIEKCINILKDYSFNKNDKILEPSFGSGNFLMTLIDKFIEIYDGDIKEKLDKILNNNIYGVELDSYLYHSTLSKIKHKYGYIPNKHNLIQYDYLIYDFNIEFDYIIGNPPFGGSINPKFDKLLEKKYGVRNGQKIKKETYSFFIIKSIEILKNNGKLLFISSDTFLTIKTMSGLRMFLYESGFNDVEHLIYFSKETNYPMVILTHTKGEIKNHIIVNNNKIEYENICLTDNFSWNISKEYTKYFKYEKLNKYIKCSGGMTIGKNEYFLREIRSDNTIVEPYNFTFFQEPITLENEIQKARLNYIGEKKIEKIKLQELNKESIRNVKIELKEESEIIQLPNDDYCYYNKSTNDILFSKPNTAIFWRDNGDACLTFKKNGNWYLHGVGGMPYFKMDGITWQLISSSIKARYLPTGYILDSGSPIAILNEKFNKDELFFILGWLLTDLATELLKNVINHTKNIQSKDIERLPYPSWVNGENKIKSINYIKKNIKELQNGNQLPNNFKETLNSLYIFYNEINEKKSELKY